MKKCAATIGLALMSPAVASAMTIECRDLAFGQRVDKLSVAVDQGRATVSSAAGQLLGSYAFEILRQSADRIVLLGRQSTLPWPSPAVTLSIDLEKSSKARTLGDLEGLAEGDRIEGAIAWVCRRVD
jgi:hypothetical protein